MKKRALILDIETSYTILASYGLREQYHSYKNILQDWHMICFSWKWLGQKAVHSKSLASFKKRLKKDPSDDFDLVKAMHDVVSEAEIMIGHNMQNFDWKKFNARVIYHRLPPLNKPVFIDTLKEVRKIAAFDSNAMGYLSRHLGIKEKPTHSSDMWLRILRGNVDAIKEAETYCRGDVQTTEDLYMRLRPYMEKHPNANLWRGKGINCCRVCGSDNIQHRGWRFNASTKVKRYACNDCGGWTNGERVSTVKFK